MKKRIVFGIMVISLTLNACQSTSNSKAHEGLKSEQVESHKSTKSIRQFLNEVDQFIDQKVSLTGIITHTCKHSGKRCFLADADGKETVRVEAGGNIVGFNRELVGSMVCVTGTLKERRLSMEYIEQMEEALKEKQVKEDGSAETCAAENNNILRMRTWMKENGKNYYSIFFIDGEDYEVVE